MGCGSSAPAPEFEADTEQQVVIWVVNPDKTTKTWEGEWRAGTGDAPTLLYSVVRKPDEPAAAAAAPATAPAAAPAVAEAPADDKGTGITAIGIVKGAAMVAGAAGVPLVGEVVDAGSAISKKTEKKTEKKDEPQEPKRPKYELLDKDGQPAWEFQLMELSGSIDSKRLKGEKAVCVVFTAPGGAAYKLLKFKSDVFKLAVYKCAAAGTAISEEDLVMNLDSNLMENTWLLTAAPGKEL